MKSLFEQMGGTYREENGYLIPNLTLPGEEQYVFRLVEQMAEHEGVTERLKAGNQMEWVARMNNIRSRATEIVNHDIIYN